MRKDLVVEGTHVEPLPHCARDLGAREMVLEVITENAPAIGLYEQLGFRATRELEVLSAHRWDKNFYR